MPPRPSLPAPDDLAGRRAALVGSWDGDGWALARALSDLTDRWFEEAFAALTGEDPAATVGMALLAVGGYGRGELTPGSDLDVLLLHDGRADVAAVAERLWYPVWDANLKLGHAVRTPKEALALAARDLDTATALLDARLVAGDAARAADVAGRASALWRKRAGRWLAELDRRAVARHARAGDVAFLLEPDVKEGRGGLRDVHVLRWAERAGVVLLPGDGEALNAAGRFLLDVRVALHRAAGRATDRLLLDWQDDVAARLGLPDADDLMARLATAARTVAWTSDETWLRVRAALDGPTGRLFSRDRVLDTGIVLRDGEVHVTAAHDVAGDPTAVLRVAAAAAGRGLRIARPTLERLGAEAPALSATWPAPARVALVDLLAAGERAVPVWEALDQRNLVERVLPEWASVRSRPQRNAYHRYTVDRHLVEAASEAARLTGRVARPDLLLVAALLHDIGKGEPGDHTDNGVRTVPAVAARMGFPPADVRVLTDLVRHHLLLADVASRRDLDDEATIRSVAETVGSLRTLELLGALTEADSKATGPAAWGPTKAALVRRLVERCEHVLRGGDAAEVVGDGFPTPEQRALLAGAGRSVSVTGSRLTVVAPDRPELFGRIAGVLALHDVEVVAAWAHSEHGRALAVFEVAGGERVPDWTRLCDQVERALDGRLAVDARLAQRGPRLGRRPRSARPVEPGVTIDNGQSATSTVLEVRAPDAPGVLYRIVRALADLDLDIRHAKVQTLGDEVVDTFYVRGPGGARVTDPDQARELERAVLHHLSG